MTDVQILTLALAVIVPLAMLIFSNSRITEAKETLRAELKMVQTELGADVKALRTDMVNRLTAIDAFLHDAVMGKLDELDRRLTALEGRR